MFGILKNAHAVLLYQCVYDKLLAHNVGASRQKRVAKKLANRGCCVPFLGLCLGLGAIYVKYLPVDGM